MSRIERTDRTDRADRADRVAQIATLHAAYAALPRGAQAALRRCSTADEIRLEGNFWRLLDDAMVPAADRAAMAHVVVCFPMADDTARESARFPRWLRATVFGDVKDGELVARSTRFRRLLVARDRAEVVHHLRRLIHHGAQRSGTAPAWGELGSDLVFWGDHVKRAWAEEFFTRARANPRSDGSDARAGGERSERSERSDGVNPQEVSDGR